MTFNQRVLWLICLLGTSLAANAAGWTAFSPVKNIQLGSTVIWVDLDPALVTNVNSCNQYPAFPGRFQMNTATDYTRAQMALYSSVLVAAAQKKSIRIYSNACSGGATTGYNTMDSIEWKP